MFHALNFKNYVCYFSWVHLKYLIAYDVSLKGYEGNICMGYLLPI